ncbi:MAG: hypothetical protein CMH34_02675 [Microbacterium sp.]|nr:hypothetical protein [Microbacterium sp.]
MSFVAVLISRRRGAASTPVATGLRLSPREARRLRSRQDREQRRAEAARSESTLQRLRGVLTDSRAASSTRPGRRGWAGRGAGYVNYVQPLPESQGTTVQVCGLWPFGISHQGAVVGVPLGKNLRSPGQVTADPMYWFLNGILSNPSAFVLSRPGLGKSTLVRRLLTVYDAWNVIPLVLSDTKPDYVALVTAMGGQTVRLSRGFGHINPLDFGPLAARVAEIPDERKRAEILNSLRERRVANISGLVRLARNGAIQAYESSILVEAIRILDEGEWESAPLLRDLVTIITSRPDRLRALTRDNGNDTQYDERVRMLLDDLTALGSSGPFGDVFARPTTTHIDVGRPVVFDLSAIDDSDLQLQAAVQSVTWSYGSAVVEVQKGLAEAGLVPPAHYVLVMDELWRMLRASSTMVYFVDALTRLNRQRGIGQILITHTMNDLKLETDQLTSIASGFVERSAMVFIGGLAPAEMGNLRTVFALSNAEQSMIEDWSAESTINPDTGRTATPAGRGKFLLKIGKAPGTPFQVTLVPEELAVNDTNTAWRGMQDSLAATSSGR